MLNFKLQDELAYRMSPSNLVLTAALAIAALSGPPVAAQQSFPTSASVHYIFFDFGRPVVNRDGQAVLDELAVAAREAPQARVAIEGFSDRAGPERANGAVSRQRAEAVQQYLVERGIEASRILLSSYGERRPLVPTEDGVREPQNRRVEVRLVN